MWEEIERRPAFHCADKSAAAELLRHEPPSALAGRGRHRLWLRGTLEQFHVRCLPKAATGGIPALPTSRFLLQIPPRRHNTRPSTNRMTTGQITCASGADDVFLTPVKKTSFSDDRQHFAKPTKHALDLDWPRRPRRTRFKESVGANPVR